MMKIKELFKVGGKLPKKTTLIIEIAGFVFLLFLWWFLTHPFSTFKLQYNANNGVGPYTFEWTGPDGFKKTISEEGFLTNLDEGKYTVVVTDSLGERVTASIELNSEIGDTVVMIPEGEQIYSGEDEELPLGVRIDAITKSSIIDKAILPPPFTVLTSYKFLHFDEDAYLQDKKLRVRKDGILKNTWLSIKLNLLGYIEAIFISLLVGFIIGLIPFFRSLWSRYIDAIRFIPLAAVTGLFIAWFGIYINMKVQFLAFGIFVFLVPVVVQRIDEVDKIYLQTSYTLGATNWQTIRKVYWPHVTSRIIDDVRVLTAISWTYIIVAEAINMDEGGLGAMIRRAERNSRLDQVFAILVLIVLIGFIQDLIFGKLDKWLFPHKTQKNKK